MKPGRRRWKLRVSVLYSFRVRAATAHFSLCFTAAPPCPLSKPPSPLIINTLHVCPRFLMSWTNCGWASLDWFSWVSKFQGRMLALKGDCYCCCYLLSQSARESACLCACVRVCAPIHGGVWCLRCVSCARCLRPSVGMMSGRADAPSGSPDWSSRWNFPMRSTASTWE